MRVKLGLVLGTFALATVWIVPVATAQRHEPSFEWACHQKANGAFVLLLVSTNSGHRDHGDATFPHEPPFSGPPSGFCPE